MLQPELSPQEFGHWFESQWLTLLRATKKCYAHPLVDTRSAGNIVNPQPSDSVMTIRGLSVYMECKTSTVETEFNACYRSHIRANQAASGRMILHFEGHYVFPFLSRSDHKLYIYEGKPVIAKYHRKSMERLNPQFSGDWSNRKLIIDEWLGSI